MRCAILVISVSFLSAAAEIPQGSHALLRMVNSVNTRTARDGDFVYMRTAAPIAANGQIVVPEGSYVQGVVTRTLPSGRVKGKAVLALRIENITMPSGKVIKISSHLASVDSGTSTQRVDPKENEIRQGTNHEQDATRVAGIAASGAAIGAVVDRSWTGAGIGGGIGAGAGLATVLLSHGRDVQLRQGDTIDVIFDHAIPVE